MKISSNVNGDFNDENNFLHNLLLTNAQVSKLRKAFANNSLANIKLSKTKLREIGQSGRPLLKPVLSLIGNVLKPLGKNVLIPLRLTAIHKKNVWI